MNSKGMDANNNDTHLSEVDGKIKKLLSDAVEHFKQNHVSIAYVQFIKALNFWYRIPEEPLNAIIDIFCTFNCNILMLDDIADSSTSRGGNPCAHIIYGTEMTLKSVMFQTFVSLKKLYQLNQVKAVELGRRNIFENYIGIATEALWRDKFECPCRDDWLAMMFHKASTHTLFAVRLMELVSIEEPKLDLTRFAMLSGLFYQLRDDYCNLTSKNYTKSKGFADDLTEGKFSLSVLHGIEKEGPNGRIAAILKQHTSDMLLKQECINLLREFGSFQYTEEILNELKSEIFNELKMIGGNPLMEKLLHKLCDFNSDGEVL